MRAAACAPRPPNNPTRQRGGKLMPILLWLLGVPISLIIVLMLLGIA